MADPGRFFLTSAIEYPTSRLPHKAVTVSASLPVFT